MLRWHTLAVYFRRKYGMRVQKIPLDAGAACPNRDGTLSGAGCTFCNARGAGTGLGARGRSLAAQWEARRQKYSAADPCRWYMAYLQSFSNTYGSLARLQTSLQSVKSLPECRGIAVGTRPDCLSLEKLDALAAAGFTETWLELGLQSAHDATLARINRGHASLCSEKAVALAAERGLLVCGHLMAGLPGESEADFLASVDWAASLPLHGLKLHNVYVPEGTPLARQYRAGAYRPLDRDEYVDLLCAALPRIPSRIVMHRLQSDPAPGELAAPAWAGQKRPLIAELLRAMHARDLWQGCAADASPARPAWFG